MKNVTIFLIFMSLLTSFAFAGSKAAIVKIMRGEAHIVSGKDKVKLKVNDWIEAGATIQTAKKSFLKLVFIDKSQMNIGPSSEIKVQRFDRKDAGVIDLVRGKIRSQVSKDYLQIDGKNRSKLFIKTSNAVMGIRGTDFLITTTGKNTAAILFEGSVVFNRLTDRKLLDSAKLDDIVDRGVRMFPGEFSAVGEKGPPTIPALLNVQQREKLEKNKSFAKNSKSIAKRQRSIVPAGLSQKVVSSRPRLSLTEKENNDGRASANPNYYVKNGQVKPANGSFVLLDTAKIVQPGQGAVLDEPTNTYIASSSLGDVNLDGTFSLDNEVKLDGPVLTIETSTIDSSIAIDPIVDTTSTLSTSTLDTLNTTSTDAQTVQISDSLNDAVKEVSTTTTTTATSGDSLAPVTDSVDNTVDATTDSTTTVTEEAGTILNRFGIKK